MSQGTLAVRSLSIIWCVIYLSSFSSFFWKSDVVQKVDFLHVCLAQPTWTTRGFWLLWLWPLLRKGARQPLQEADIYECHGYLCCFKRRHVYSIFQYIWEPFDLVSLKGQWKPSFIFGTCRSCKFSLNQRVGIRTSNHVTVPQKVDCLMGSFLSQKPRKIPCRSLIAQDSKTFEGRVSGWLLATKHFCWIYNALPCANAHLWLEILGVLAFPEKR